MEIVEFGHMSAARRDELPFQVRSAHRDRATGNMSVMRIAIAS
jgi:hypothetical protein